MGVMVPCEKILERAKAREGRPDRAERADHAFPRRDGARGSRDGAAGFKLPLLIGGATTSRAHTAVKIAPHLQRAGGARARREPRGAGDHQPSQRRRQGGLRRAASRRVRGAPQGSTPSRRPSWSRSRRRATTGRRSRGAPRTSPSPEFIGVRVLDDFPLATLREFIDWTPFFHTWELKGVYPRILEHEKYGEQARQLFADANALLDEIIAKKLLTRARRVRPLPGQRGGRRRRALHRRDAHATCSSASTFCASRRQGEGRAQPLARRFHRAARAPGSPITSAPSRSPPGLASRSCATASARENDDYNAIMAEALADRLAEAFAECLHKRVRDEWGYGRTRGPEQATSSSQEKYRGIRPAAGYPACPDHTEKGTLWKLLDVEKSTGMQLTESFAMWPGSSVSGLYFAHPESRYFSLGKIDRDQVDRLPRAQGDERRRGRALARPEPQLR